MNEFMNLCVEAQIWEKLLKKSSKKEKKIAKVPKRTVASIEQFVFFSFLLYELVQRD